MKNQDNKLLVDQEQLSIANSDRRHLLSELLPDCLHVVRKQDALVKIVNEYELLVLAAEKAMESLSKGLFSHFDPLVGENACQIRAIKNCFIFSDYPIASKALLKHIRSVKEKIKGLRLNTKASLKQVLAQEKMDLAFTYNEIYLIKSFLLTFLKVSDAPKKEMPYVKNDRTDRKKIKEIHPVGIRFIEKLVKKIRKSLSVFSVSFVKEMALEKHKSLQEIAVLENDLHCLPYYQKTEFLMKKALEKGVPIVMIVSQKATDQDHRTLYETPLFFKPTPSGYQPASLEELDSSTPALVLEGSAFRKADEFSFCVNSWKQDLLQLGPMDLFLAHAASHRQYPDNNRQENQSVVYSESDKYHFYKEKAEEWGCSMNNPFGCFINHAFCETIENLSAQRSLNFS